MPEIKRIEPGRRFSEAVVCDGVVYISGQVDLARNRDPKVQTAEVLKTIGRTCWPKPGRTKNIFFGALSTCRIWATFPR